MTQSSNRFAIQAISYWATMAILLAISCAMVVAGDSSVLWTAPFAVCVFFAGAWMLISRTGTQLLDLTPLSWSLMVFFAQLVAIPLMILWSGPSIGTMRVLPAPESINQGLLLSSFAFVAFAVGFKLRHRSEVEKAATARIAVDWNPPVVVAFSFIAIGLVGFYFYSVQSPSLQFFTDPKSARELARSTEAGVGDGAATVLRPFLVAGLVLLWVRVMRSGLCRQLPVKIAAALVVACVIAVAMSTYSFNRAAFVVPMVAMAAVLTNRYKMPVALFWLSAFAALLPLWAVGSFRKSGSQSSDFMVALRELTANEPVRQLSEGVQVYGGGPQYLGYLIEQQGESSLYWGSTLVSSVLAPIPVLGRSFRETSGTAVYNYMIYGSTVSADQVIPFSGELLINFHLPGVLAGFALLGMCLAWVHEKFRSSTSAIDTYFLQYSGIWLSFLITGSLLVIAQIAIYMCLPMYAWIFIRRLVRRRRNRVSSRAYAPISQTHGLQAIHVRS